MFFLERFFSFLNVSSLFRASFFDSFILIAGDIKVTPHNNVNIAFTNCALFSVCETEINDWFKQNNSTKSETGIIRPSLWDYFDAVILVTGDILVTADNNKHVAFTNFVLFSPCQTVK